MSCNNKSYKNKAIHHAQFDSLIGRFLAFVFTALLIGFIPAPAAAHPRAYVTNQGGNAEWVSVIDTATDASVQFVFVGVKPEGLAATPDGAFVYVANFQADNVSVIRTADNVEVTRVPVGIKPFDVAVTPDGKRYFGTSGETVEVTYLVDVEN